MGGVRERPWAARLEPDATTTLIGIREHCSDLTETAKGRRRGKITSLDRPDSSGGWKDLESLEKTGVLKTTNPFS